MNFPNVWIGFPPVTERGMQNKKRTTGTTFWIRTTPHCGICNKRIRGLHHFTGAHHLKLNLRK